MQTRWIRRVLFVTAGLIPPLLAVSAPAAKASPTFNPVITVSRGTDAARAVTPFGLYATQPDNQAQIGKIDIKVPGAFTLNTAVTGGGSDGTQIGTLAASFYTGASNARTTLDLTGTLNDDNSPAHLSGDCGFSSLSLGQCLQGRVNVPGYGNININVPIKSPASTGGVYEVTADVSGVWTSSVVTGLQAKLKSLTLLFSSQANNTTVFANPQAAGSYPFEYSLASANAYGYSAGDVPDCGAVCSIPMPSVEYPPTTPGLIVPGNGTFTTTDSTVHFVWGQSTDLNGDAIAYTLTVKPASGVAVVYGPITPTSFDATLPAGGYRWSVTATDNSPVTLSATSGTANLTVLDRAAALAYTNALPQGTGTTKPDVLLVYPGQAFVYELNGKANTASELTGGCTQCSATQGVVDYNASSSTLAIAYVASPVATAAGVVHLSGASYLFATPPAA